ncbi:MAG: hypothetical protein DRN55_09150 [Thermoplasmata archaeon]|nr:MAG: hypothetical protein DRN55_09150 [Thermoplasmata archaeon]
MIYVQTGGERIIYLGRDKRREIEEVFDIGDLLRLIHGGYDVRVNVTDINGNWATGKTHIDSALQTLKKGLSALLDMIVAALKVIAKVASMLLEMIRKIIVNMIKPVMKPIKSTYNTWKESIFNILTELVSLAVVDKDMRNEKLDINNKIEGLASNFVYATTASSFILLLNTLTIAITVIQMVVSGFLYATGSGAVIAIISGIALSGLVRSTVGTVLIAAGSFTLGFILGELIKPNNIIGALGEAFITTLGIYFITKCVQDYLAIRANVVREEEVTKRDPDIFGLKLALIGFFIGVLSASVTELISKISKILNIEITYRQEFIIRAILTGASMVLSFLGALTAILGEGANDKIPGIGGKLDEFIDIGIVGYSFAKYGEIALEAGERKCWDSPIN